MLPLAATTEQTQPFASFYDLDGKRAEALGGVEVLATASTRWPPPDQVIDELTTLFLAAHSVETGFQALVVRDRDHATITYSNVLVLDRWRAGAEAGGGTALALHLAVPAIFTIEMVDGPARDRFLTRASDLLGHHRIESVAFKVAGRSAASASA